MMVIVDEFVDIYWAKQRLIENGVERNTLDKVELDLGLVN